MVQIIYCCICTDLILDHMVTFDDICCWYAEFHTPIEVCSDPKTSSKNTAVFFGSVKALEKKGFVISTETGIDIISILPRGFDTHPEHKKLSEENTYAFCLKKGHIHEFA